MIFNKLQQEVIDCEDSKVIVTAPPGSGKTASLIGAIRKYHEDYPEDKIVAITFTKKAAEELKMKLFGVDNVTAATIHSWSLKELNRLGIKYNFRVSLLDEEKIKELLVILARRCGYYSLNFFLLYFYVMGNYNIDVSDGVKSKFNKIMKEYIKYKRANKLYDFTDLPLYLFDVLNEFNETITNIDGLFVDEFQDVDPIQAQIFDKVAAKKKFYIGDKDQSIYIFRGASSNNIDNIEGFTAKQLQDNYRSYQSISDFATTIKEEEPLTMLMIDKLRPSWIHCVREERRGTVLSVRDGFEVFDLATNKYYSNGLTVVENFINKKPFILCRSNKQVKTIQELGYGNVSTIHQAKGLEYDNVIVTDFALKGEEEMNIAYVGCTRARDGLMIISHFDLMSILRDMCFDNPEFFEPTQLF